MLCGAAPTCMFPHSGIPPSAPGRPPRSAHGCTTEVTRTLERENGILSVDFTFLSYVTSPAVCVRDGPNLLCLYLVEQGGEDPPGLTQLITGPQTEGGERLEKKTQIKQNTRSRYEAHTCGQNASGSHRRRPGSAARKHQGASRSAGRSSCQKDVGSGLLRFRLAQVWSGLL